MQPDRHLWTILWPLVRVDNLTMGSCNHFISCSLTRGCCWDHHRARQRSNLTPLAATPWQLRWHASHFHMLIRSMFIHIYIYIQRQKKQGGGGSSSKATLWEGGHRMVGLARWPGMISPRVCDALASSLDCLPTLLALAGVKLPTDRVYDGIDLAPVLFKGIEQGHTNLFHPNKRSS